MILRMQPEMVCMMFDGIADRSKIETGKSCPNQVEKRFGRSLSVEPFNAGEYPTGLKKKL